MIDPLLGNMGAPSFRAWHVIARILDGDAALLSPADRALAEEITQRTRFPAQPITEFYGGPSRRAGKSRFLQCRMAWRASLDYRDRLAPGEWATIAALAPATEQSEILINYLAGTVNASPLLSGQKSRETTSEIEFEHRTVVRVYAGSFRTTRGPTYAGVYLDEASFLRSEESALPDVELIRAVRPGLITLGGDLFVTSSPYMKRGAMFDAYRKHFGNNDSPALYVAGPSILFNPTLNQAAIAQAFDDDPEAAGAEWGGQHRNDLSAPFAELVDAAIDTGVWQRPYLAMLPEGRATEYFSFTDPSGGSSGDSWSTYITHWMDNELLADACLEIRPPFNTAEAAKSVAEFLKSYGLFSTVGDQYAGAWPSDALSANGIGYTPSELTKSEIYKECVPLFTSGRVHLLDHKRTSTQLRMIERRVRAGGKDSFDHPPGGRDDNSNALCGALLRASRRNISTGEVTCNFSPLHERIQLELGGANVAVERLASPFDRYTGPQSIVSELEQF